MTTKIKLVQFWLTTVSFQKFICALRIETTETPYFSVGSFLTFYNKITPAVFGKSKLVVVSVQKRLFLTHQLLLTNCLSACDCLVELALKGLKRAGLSKRLSAINGAKKCKQRLIHSRGGVQTPTKLNINVTIVTRNGMIVSKLVWIEYDLQLNLSSRRYQYPGYRSINQM